MIAVVHRTQKQREEGGVIVLLERPGGLPRREHRKGAVKNEQECDSKKGRKSTQAVGPSQRPRGTRVTQHIPETVKGSLQLGTARSEGQELGQAGGEGLGHVITFELKRLT